MKEQQIFIEEQFEKFEERLDNIKTEVTKNSNEIKKLKTDHKGLSTQLAKSEQSLHQGPPRIFPLKFKTF